MEALVRLKLRLVSGTCVVVELPQTARASELLAAAADAAQVDASHVRVLSGYPPRDLSLSGGASGEDGDTLLSSLGLRNNETLLVQVDAAASAPASAAPAAVAAAAGGEPSAPAPASLRPPRAAKHAAAANITAAVKEDEASLRAAKASAAAKRAKAAGVGGSAAPLPGGAPRVATLSSPGGSKRSAPSASAPSSASKPSNAYWSRLGGAAAGRTLAGESPGDAAAAARAAAGGNAGSRPQPPRKRRRGMAGFALPANSLSLEEKLVMSSGRRGGSRRSGEAGVDFLRDASQAALASREEQARAERRLHAAMSGEYEISVRTSGGRVPQQTPHPPHTPHTRTHTPPLPHHLSPL